MRKTALWALVITMMIIMTLEGAIGGIISYDYSNNQSVMEAYGCQTPAALPPSGSSEPSCSTSWVNYTTQSAIDSSDDDSLTFIDKQSWLYFKAYLDETESGISWLNWTYEGNGGDSNGNTNIYVWNESATTWDKLDNFASASDSTRTIPLESASDYINSSGTVYLIVERDNTGQFTGGADFVKLELDYELNVAPNDLTVSINSSDNNNYTNGTLTCFFTPTDNNTAETLTANITWFLNDEQNITEIGESVTNGTLFTDTIDSSNVTKDDEWICQIEVCDDDGECNTKTNSSTLTVPNFVPTLSGTLSINDSSPADDVDIECDNSSISITDIDAADDFSWYYDWIKNSESQEINYEVLGTGNTSAGEIWECRTWVGDGDGNSSNVTSSSVAIASSLVAPSITYANATSENGVQSDSDNPTTNNTLVNLSVVYSDANTGENHSAFFCKTDSATSTGCTGEYWCNASSYDPTTNVSCAVNISSLSSESYTYYAFVADNGSLISASTSGTFAVNHPPLSPSITFPANDSWVAQNSTWVNFTASDGDSGDTLNYTLWCDEGGTALSQILENSSTYLNHSTLNESNYTCIVQAFDNHGYRGANSTSYLFKVDLTVPSVSNESITSKSFYTSGFANFTVDCNDSLSGLDNSTVSYDITTPVGNSYGVAMSVMPGYTTKFYHTPTIYGTTGTYNITNVYCSDVAGGQNNFSTNLTFVTESAPVATGGGGGGGGPAPPKQTIEIKQEATTRCGNNICEGDFGEDPLECPEDCRVFDLEAMFCLPLFNCGNWKHAWFINGVIVVVAGMLVYGGYRSKKTGRLQ